MKRLLAAAAAIMAATISLSLPGGAADAVTGSGGVTLHHKAERVDFDANGHTSVLHSYDISLTVDQTKDLRGRQELEVSWSGAPATKGIVGDTNSNDAALQEYPFVLLQCRGTAATITPQTCWSQGPADRYQGGATRFQAWRLDGRASWADRALNYDANDKITGASVGAPSPVPAPCVPLTDRFARWVPFRAVHSTYAGGPAACAGAAPETGVLGGSAMPNNTTYGITGADGRGSAQFAAWTDQENASLGCNSTTACSLVAIPIVGISCDDYGTTTAGHEPIVAAAVPAARASCTSADSADAYANAGDPQQQGTLVNTATTGLLWWSASNWTNRLVVPLTFAPTPASCSVLNPKPPLQIYGSIALGDVTNQWAPTFCTDASHNPFLHVTTSDAASRNLLNVGTIQGAFSTRGPDGAWSHPVVQAPVALTGFAVTFEIDGRDGAPVKQLRLTARLLAKLLTQSYPAERWIQQSHPGLASNPLNLTLDPEFQQLNPQVTPTELDDTRSTLLALSSETDLMWALTNYINADASARAWLNGQPDRWGMTVNSSYKNIALPLESWTLLDNWTPPLSQPELANDPCYPLSPSPYLNLVANPVSAISTILQNQQFAISNVGNRCNDSAIPAKYVINGRQVPGHRFVMSVVPLTAVHRYSLRPAMLQTSGTSFVLPDDAGLRAAVPLLKPADGLWSLDYKALATAPSAYPGAMPVYADFATTGLDTATATAAAQFVRFAAGDGQVSGTANGRLAYGALPLTAANGAGALHAYALCAADAIQAQKGIVPTIGEPCESAASPTASPTPPPAVGPVVAPAMVDAPSAVPPAEVMPTTALSYSTYKTIGSLTFLGGWGVAIGLGVAVLLAGYASGSRWGGLVIAAIRPFAGRVRTAVKARR